jgi:predicted ABC-type ATPase
MPNVIAGSNGAGKSTLAPALLRDTFGIPEYVNADTIAEGLSAFAPKDASFDAGRVMLERLRNLASARKDFAFETTLASRFYAGWLKELQSQGYRVNLIFLWLRDLEIAIQRVNERVRFGGHSIPEDTIRRRYERGLRIFLNFIYRLQMLGGYLMPLLSDRRKLRDIMRIMEKLSSIRQYGIK